MRESIRYVVIALFAVAIPGAVGKSGTPSAAADRVLFVIPSQARLMENVHQMIETLQKEKPKPFFIIPEKVFTPFYSLRITAEKVGGTVRLPNITPELSGRRAMSLLQKQLHPG